MDNDLEEELPEKRHSKPTWPLAVLHGVMALSAAVLLIASMGFAGMSVYSMAHMGDADIVARNVETQTIAENNTVSLANDETRWSFAVTDDGIVTKYYAGTGQTIVPAIEPSNNNEQESIVEITPDEITSDETPETETTPNAQEPTDNLLNDVAPIAPIEAEDSQTYQVIDRNMPDAPRVTDISGTAPETRIPLPTEDTQLVWLPKTADSSGNGRYHSRNDCGNMDSKNARQVTFGAAKAEGHDPCSNCWEI